MKCEYEEEGHCSGEIRNCHAMTAYHFEGIKNSPEDPNKDFIACDGHYEDYAQHWQEQWDEYYGMVYEGIAAAQYQRENSYVEEYGPSPQDLFDDFASRIKFK